MFWDDTFKCLIMIGIVTLIFSFMLKEDHLILPDLICTKTDTLINLKEDNFSENCFACGDNIENCARVSICKECNEVVGITNKCENCGSFDFVYMYQDYLENNDLHFESVSDYQHSYSLNTVSIASLILCFVVSVVILFIGIYGLWSYRN